MRLTFSRLTSLLLILSLCGALAACGKKGPLYLPDPAKTSLQNTK